MVHFIARGVHVTGVSLVGMPHYEYRTSAKLGKNVECHASITKSAKQLSCTTHNNGHTTRQKPVYTTLSITFIATSLHCPTLPKVSVECILHGSHTRPHNDISHFYTF